MSFKFGLDWLLTQKLQNISSRFKVQNNSRYPEKYKKKYYWKVFCWFLDYFKSSQKKMFNQDEGKIECAVGNREICVWQGKKVDIVLILFLTSGFAAFICLWLLVLPNSNNLINHVLWWAKLLRSYKGTVNIPLHAHLSLPRSLA